MDVLIVGTDPFYMVQFRSTLIERLHADGCRVTVVCWPANEQQVASLRGAGAINVIPVAFSQSQLNPLGNAALLVNLFRIIRSVRCDAILCFTAKPVVTGSLAASLAGVPNRVALVEGLGFAFTEGAGLKRRVARMLLSLAYRVSLRRTTATIVLNTDDQEELASITGLPKTHFELVAGIGVEPRYFVSSPLPHNTLRFLFVGRMLRDKGVVDLLEAAAILRERGSEFELVLAGGRDANPSSVPEDLLDNLLRRSGATWLGHTKDIPQELAAASVLVLPTYYREGFPRVVMEAMAAGRPVILTDVPGCRDVVVHDQTGLMVPPHNPRVLADAMQRFLDERELAPRLGKAAKAHAESHFRAEDRTADIVEVLYRGGPMPMARV